MTSDPLRARHPYDLDPSHSTLLYNGPAELIDARGESGSADVEVIFKWLPSPRIRWRITGSEESLTTAALDGEDPRLLRLTGTWDGLGSPAVENESRELPLDRGIVVGPEDNLDQLLVHVLNLYVPLEQSYSANKRLVWEFGPWHLELGVAGDARDMRRYLRSTRLYTHTHLLSATRLDGATFLLEEADDMLNRLFVLLAFLNGSRVGLALPVGLRMGKPVTCVFEASKCSRGGFAFTWTDSTAFADQSSELIGKAWRFTADDIEFGWPVLHRAIEMAIEANHLSPVDVTHPTCQAALELLAVTVLVHREGWLDRHAFNRLEAAARIRLLCGWAGIPTDIPAMLNNAIVYGKHHSLDPLDGPRLITHVRREIVHPPKKAEWPDNQTQTECWRLAQTYIELVLLRIFGYEGVYATRYHLTGRWAGTVERVPWADAS